MAKNNAAFLQVILIGFIALLTTGPIRAAVEEPPEPPFPDSTGLTREQSRESYGKWRAAHEAWEANLTVEQLMERDRRQREEQAKSQEPYRRRQRLPLPTDGYDWKQSAAERKLSSDAIALLEQHKIAFGDSARQSFSPYLGGPVFITSDSLLNGFHVLFEDSFRELELRRAAGFRKDFEGLLSAMRKIADQRIMSPERFAAGSRHAELVIGPALVLCGTPLEFFDKSLRGEIQAQADKIRAADKVELPAWLAPAEPTTLLALDYRRCKPVGFYADSPRLADYFRATRWLQMVPFRAAREPEFDGILLLGLAAKDSRLKDGLRSDSRLVGPPDDPTMLELQEAMDSSYPRDGGSFDQQLRSVRVELVRWLIDRGYYRINSDLRMRATLQDSFPQLTFRVIAPSALPDAVLFQRLLDRDLKPSGLAVAAMLGSAFAEGRLAPNEKDDVENGKALLGEDALKAGRRNAGQIYLQYLNALSALFLAPAPEAPVFMKSEEWSAKSCQTALAGWSQMRHTFTLQAKMNVLYLGLATVPPGFVEANPEFFARMARLIEDTQDALETSGSLLPPADANTEKRSENGLVSISPPLPELRQRWIALARIARTLEAMAHKELRQEPWTKPEEGLLKSYGETMAGIMGYAGNSWLSPRDDAPRWAEVCGFPNRGVSLAAAIGRPRTIYVLYPWQGMEILCVGSVMQYYEYESKQRLTDGEWLSLLDSPEAPAIPSWLAPYAKPPAKPAEGRH